MPKAQEVKVYEGSGSVNCDRWLHGTVWVILTFSFFLSLKCLICLVMFFNLSDFFFVMLPCLEISVITLCSLFNVTKRTDSKTVFLV